jgi:hypothetical protein
MESEISSPCSQDSHTHLYSMPDKSSKQAIYYAWFEVITAVVIKSPIFWVITECIPLKVNLLHPSFLLGLFFDFEDGGDKFLPNIGQFSTDYTAL